jgi:MFS family permease
VLLGSSGCGAAAAQVELTVPDLFSQRLLPRRALARTFRSLRYKTYRLYFFAQLISMSGTWMESVALGWLVLELTGSAMDLGITVALQFTPVLVLGPWAGLIADRMDKRRLLFFTQVAAAVFALCLGLLTLTGAVSVWVVWVLAVLTGTATALDSPARQTFIVEMVGRHDLANAVGLNNVIVNASRLIGPAIAGALIARVNVASCFLVNAASFLAMVAALLAMRPEELQRSAPVRRARRQVRQGLAYAWRTVDLRVPLLMMAAVSTLGYNFSVLLPVLAKEVFGRGGGTYGAFTAAMGAGALIGALVTAALARANRPLLLLSTAAFGVCTVAVALAPTLTAAFVLLVPLGAAAVMFVATVTSLLQLHAAPAMRGRVMSLWSMLFLGATPLGSPLAGALAAGFGARVALACGGAATLITAVAAAAGLRRFRRHVSGCEPPATLPDSPEGALPVPPPRTGRDRRAPH